MSQPPQSPWDNPKTPKVCPTGQGWNTFSYNFTHGHPGYICDAGEHFLEADGTRDTEKEAIANSHHKLYLESSAKHRKSAGNSKAQQEALAEFLAPMKKQAIDNTWHALYDLQRKRKNGKAGPRPEKVEEVAHLYERYKLKFPYVGKEKDVPRDASMTMAGPSAQLEFLKEQAAALARAEADKQGQLGGDNRSGKQTVSAKSCPCLQRVVLRQDGNHSLHAVIDIHLL